MLIGLTLRPAQPGPNNILLYVLPIEGPAASADVALSLTVNGQPVPVGFCSRTCRSGRALLFGGEHVEVDVAGDAGGVAAFDLPPLPAPDGSALLQEVQQRMHQLGSFHIDEVLGPSDPPLHGTYDYQSPDRMRFELSTGAQSVFIGPTRYSRQDPSAPWQVESIGVALQVPGFVWDTHTPTDIYVAPLLIGSDYLGGVPTQVLAFFLSAGQTPLWFRLCVDADGLVHQVQMRTQGHFMDHHLSNFDAPLSIEPPAP